MADVGGDSSLIVLCYIEPEFSSSVASRCFLSCLQQHRDEARSTSLGCNPERIEPPNRCFVARSQSDDSKIPPISNGDEVGTTFEVGLPFFIVEGDGFGVG